MFGIERDLPQSLPDSHVEQHCPSFNLPTRMQGGCLRLARVITGRGGALPIGRAVSRPRPAPHRTAVGVEVGKHAP